MKGGLEAETRVKPLERLLGKSSPDGHFGAVTGTFEAFRSEPKAQNVHRRFDTLALEMRVVRDAQE